MKISKSKQELARIISENGGWREGAEFAVQGQETKIVGFSKSMPYRRGCGWFIKGEMPVADFKAGHVITNWHQTILSRDEYFHLYPTPDADGWIERIKSAQQVDGFSVVDVRFRDGVTAFGPAHVFDWSVDGGEDDIISYRLHKPEQSKPEFCESVMRSIPGLGINSKNIDINQVDDINAVESKPTIEQLAADYRNAKDYAERKQQEADDAKADVGAKLKALKLAGKEHGLLVSPITAKQDPEPELVIKVQVGDEVECIKSNVTPDNFRGMVGTVLKIDCSSTPYLVDFGRHIKIWCYEVKFIRRP